MTMDSLIKKAVAKTGDPIKLKRRNAQPEAIEQAKVIAWARANERNYPFLVRFSPFKLLCNSHKKG